MKSWKPVVQTDASGKWYDNGLRFRTQKEALDNASNLMDRWMLVRASNAEESEDEPNYEWKDGGLVPIPSTKETTA